VPRSGATCVGTKILIAVSLSWWTWSSQGLAEAELPENGNRSEAADSIPEASLPPLPDISRLDALQPTAEDVQELGSKLSALFSEEADAKETAIGELLEVRPRLVAAIHHRIIEIADRSDKEKMKRLFNEARRQLRDEPHSLERNSPTGLRQTEPDLLLTLLQSNKLKGQTWQESVNLVALLRMLSALATVEAARELIFAYSRFGEFVRLEVQQRLSRMKDRSIAALIEARRNPAEKISRWAGLRLDQMGKAIPGETVRTNDFDALADILRAYGRVRDPDAARIVVSFANSERSQLRVAARQAIAMLGPVGLWQLRDAYEDVVGRRPRRDWTWERTARELFGEFDRLRLARVYGTFVEGMRALQKGDLEAMGQAFDTVLAKDPLFEKRAQMAPGYFRLAQYFAGRNPAAASQAAMRVLRLAPDPKLKAQARSLLMTLRAAASGARGVVDTNRLEIAVEQDPENQWARGLLANSQPGATQNRVPTIRWISSVILGGVGLLSVLFVLFRRARREPEFPTLLPDRKSP
jgi:hypothetical protein